jgi:hypothetical protein
MAINFSTAMTLHPHTEFPRMPDDRERDVPVARLYKAMRHPL